MVLRVNLPKKELDEISRLVRPLGFKNGQQFVEAATHEKLLALKKTLFLRNAKEIRNGLRRTRVSLPNLLKDFEKARRGTRHRG